MDKEAWHSTVRGVAKELDTTKHTHVHIDKRLTATLENELPVLQLFTFPVIL